MNICADCQTPINTCSWEREFKPVEGWKAEKKKLLILSVNGERNFTESYDVTECPLYKGPDDTREKSRAGCPYRVKARNIVTGDVIRFDGILKAADYFGINRHKLKQYFNTNQTIYGYLLTCEGRGDGASLSD